MAEVALDSDPVDTPTDAPTDAPAPATGAPGSALADTPDAPVVTPADWPADWRTKLAAGDEKALKRLERFQSPADILKSYRALEQKVSSGEIKAVTPFPDKGTAAEQKAWRTEQGLPETPDKYDLKLDNGLVIGDADKPIIDEFLKDAHGRNMPPGMVKSTVEWYFKNQEALRIAQEKADIELGAKTQDELRGDWGNDYRRNINQIKALLGTAPEGVSELIEGARLADGSPLANHPGALRFLASLAHQINPVATVVPNASGNVASAIDDEIKSIETTMREKPAAYRKDKGMQDRYKELLGARSRVKN